MRLKDLQAALADYVAFLNGPRALQHWPLWEAQRLFQERWNLDAPDLAAMYGASLDSTQTRRYWSRDDYQPRQLMVRFMQQQPDFARQMFADLFREDKSVDGRMARFVFACDELLRDHQERHPHDKQTTHYHNDGYQIASLYLAFRYPEAHSPYAYLPFTRTLQRIGATDIPATHDLERFDKVSRTLFKFLQNDAAVQEAHSRRIDPTRDYTPPSMLIVYDFMCALS